MEGNVDEKLEVIETQDLPESPKNIEAQNIKPEMTEEKIGELIEEAKALAQEVQTNPEDSSKESEDGKQSPTIGLFATSHVAQGETIRVGLDGLPVLDDIKKPEIPAEIEAALKVISQDHDTELKQLQLMAPWLV
jgi:hypothetical protein